MLFDPRLHMPSRGLPRDLGWRAGSTREAQNAFPLAIVGGAQPYLSVPKSTLPAVTIRAPAAVARSTNCAVCTDYQPGKNHCSPTKNPACSTGWAWDMAEKQGFEPWVALLPQLISSQSRSATPASLHGADFDSSQDGIATKYDIYQMAK